MKRKPYRWVTRAAWTLSAVTLLLAAGQNVESGQGASPRGSQTVSTSKASRGTKDLPVGRIAHIVIVIEENHSYSHILGRADAPFINALARDGALMTKATMEREGSEPNYLALFSGSTQGVYHTDCQMLLGAPNLATQLHAAGLSFVNYEQGLPRAGYGGCIYGNYAKKHNAVAFFWNVPSVDDQPMTVFTHDYRMLPTVSFVVPDLDHDMHSGTVAQADDWLRANLGGYVAWAQTHDSLFILTWDEGNDGPLHWHIPTIIDGAFIKPGQYSQGINHYNLLRTIEDLYHLTPLGHARQAAPLTGLWTSPVDARH